MQPAATSDLASRIKGYPRVLLEVAEVLKTYPRAARLVWEASRGYTVLFVILNILSAASAPLEMWLFKSVVDGVVRSLPYAAVSGSRHLSVLLGCMALVWVAGEAVESLANIVRDVLGHTVEFHINRLMYLKSTSLDQAFFETPSYFDV